MNENKYKLAFNTLSLYSDTIDPVTKRRNALLFGVTEQGHPRITCFITDSNKKTHGLQATFTFKTLGILTSMLQVVCGWDTEGEKKYEIKCLKPEWVDNQRTENKIVISTLVLGKNIDGSIFIGITAPGKPREKFSIRPDLGWHIITKNGNDAANDVDLNARYSKMYIDKLTTLFSKVECDNEIRKLPIVFEPTDNGASNSAPDVINTKKNPPSINDGFEMPF